MRLSPGSSLGPYEVVGLVGAGGMGEVYRARDTRLERTVAIKVIPQQFARDGQRMARFQREAQVLASLNHPNIASIYGLEEGEDQRGLVMELVEGPTLSERLKQGAIPIEEALPIAKQIAEALEYAHERGIIHRDLKPANIKLTHDGRVKLLDFGLAKALQDDARSRDGSDSPTLSIQASEAGIILGTAAYMSPEQAKGKTVDRRADIWSFGVVLFEMLTGRQMFTAETTTEILAAVMRAEPDWTMLPKDVPPRIRDLLKRCLMKDDKRRLRDIGDARLELENGPEATFEAGYNASPKRFWRVLPWAIGVCAILIAAWALLNRPGSTMASAEVMHLDIAYPPGVERTAGGLSSGAVRSAETRHRKGTLAVTLLGLAVLIAALGLYFSRLRERRSEWNAQDMTISQVTQNGNAVNVAISPDGRYVVYALREGEKQSLNVRQVATGSDVQILPPDEVWFWGLTFSPDANYIDFVRSEKNNPANTFLYRMPALGGTAHLAMQRGIDSPISYSPDDTHFAFLRVPSANAQVDVLIANADGSNERVLTTRPHFDLFNWGTAWSPDGKTVAFTSPDTRRGLRSVLWAASVADGSLREVYSTADVIGRPRWLPDGSGVLASIASIGQGLRGQLWLISYPKGQAKRLTNDLMNYGLCCLDLTQDGKTLVDTEVTTLSDLWIAPAGNAAKARQITPRGPAVGRFSWMPDGRIVLASGDGNLSALNSDGSGRSLLTPGRTSWDPSVCGDGRYIVYSAYGDQKIGIWRMDADGSNSIRIADETFALSPQCSPDGRWVIYLRGPSWIPMRVAITGEKPPETLSQSPAVGVGSVPALSPDGKRIAYVASPGPTGENPDSPSASQPNQLKVIAFDGGALLHQFDWPALAGEPRWTPGGQAVDYVLTRNAVSNIWRQNLAGGAPKQVTNFDSGQIFNFDWSRDGRQLALTRGAESSDVILISNFR